MTYTYNDIYGIDGNIGTAIGNKYCHCNKAKKTFSWSVGAPAPFYYVSPSSTGQTHHWSHWFSETPNVVNKYLYY